MPELDRMIEEANRQFTICNACRYCEGYCPVFPAMERLAEFAESDVSHLANLCHDCRACFQACMYAPPHEFGVNIPSLLTTARTRAYTAHCRPRALGKLFEAPVRTALFALVVGAAVTVASYGYAAIVGPSRMSVGDGQFYRVLPYTVMLVPSLVIGALAALAAGSVFVSALLDGPATISTRSGVRALRDVVRLRGMEGGGGGCFYPETERGSPHRRWLHQSVAGGFGLAFAATVAAAVEQHIFGRLPPYPVVSAPVVLGVLGGVAMITGCLGLLALKRQSSAALTTSQARQGEYAELVSLLAVAATGLLLLLLRDSKAMGWLLAIHLVSVYGLLLALPYSRLIHAAYRAAAVLRHAAETG